KTYYRIKIINNQGQYYYSKTILLNGENGKISFLTVINPFAEKLEFSLFNNANDAGAIALLIDLSGRVILRKNIMLQRGENRVVFENTNTLAAGIYFLSIKNNQTSIQQKVYKQYR
ncbi:MAG TPA: T9SS type A sorting domain-containing protein, partial [Chitinophagaceae bacterium]|nr:T9SS type A sorting domain-containing protein [Chitinophagaceae bacterium]